ncbi:MAG: cytochrome c3 family protein [Deltaproteobacteria bacterium]|nr:cytochrome c3 family protein [Deltaproteobacteria bacterium]
MRKPLKDKACLLFFAFFSAVTLAGCGGMAEDLDTLINADVTKKVDEKANLDDYYEKFYKEVARRSHIKPGTSDIKALDSLPKDPSGNVNWTAAVVNGYINPRGSLDPGVPEDQPLNLNIFIEAKVPLMANVLFPHSIHTYWLSCNNCHPKIFIPEAGANPISMDEIFKGQWCGRCHGKVAFTFWPRENCVRCHIVLKGQSLERETFK